MKTLLAAGVALSALAVGSPAHAHRIPVDEGGDTAPCVTYAEFGAAQSLFLSTDLTRGQVRRIFDTDGRRTSADVQTDLGAAAAPGYEPVIPKHKMTRHYLGCIDAADPHGSNVYIVFNTRRDRAVTISWE